MSSKVRHIIILTHSYPSIFQPLAGIFWKEQAAFMASLGYQMSVLAIVPISWKDIFKKKKLFYSLKKVDQGVYVEMYCFPSIPFFHFLSCYISKWIGIKKFNQLKSQKGKPDIVHLQRFEAGLLALKIKKKHQIPYIVTEHSSRFLLNQIGIIEHKLAKRVFQNASARMAVSPYLKKSLENQFKHAFNYIPNGVDAEFFNAQKINAKDDAEFVFFNAGNFTENKNIAMLLKAFSQFQQEQPNSKLILAGDGPLKMEAQSLVHQMNLDAHIDFKGRVNRIEMRSLFSKSDVYVLASSKETFGVVLIEALCMGKPVISTKCGGPESIVSDSSLGELCDISESGLFASMKKVYLQKDNYDNQAIRNSILHIFDQRKIVDQYAQFYINAIGEKN